MPEQNQPPPWAERTVEMPPEALDLPPQGAFRRGVAAVSVPGPRTEPVPLAAQEQVDTDWSYVPQPQRFPPGYHLRQLRSGGEWSMIGALFAFVCWGIWAISARGTLATPVVTFVLTLLVAAGLFGLSRALGRLVLERQLGRVRRSARGAHLVAGLFLLGVGIAYLRQTEWVMAAWRWLTSW